jgi:SpoVK/Ycf46/Vps4 family AAA+-type ATPase
MYKTLLEKSILMVLGMWLTYIFSSRLLEKFNDTDTRIPIDFYVPAINAKLKLNKYEQLISEDIVKKTNYTMSNIIGHDAVKEDIIQTIIRPLNENFNKLPNGILLHGNPGTGKTLIAKCISDSVSANFIQFNVSNIENKYYGESSKYLYALFSLARKIQPCIIFIDEIDGFCGERNPMEQFHINSLKTQFLGLVDGLDSKDTNDKIICIGATNKLNYIDKAVKRRMRKHIHLKLPDKENVASLFKMYLPKDILEHITDECLNMCNGMSGSDIYELSKDIELNQKFNSSSKTIEEIILNCVLQFTNDETSSDV